MTNRDLILIAAGAAALYFMNQRNHPAGVAANPTPAPQPAPQLPAAVPPAVTAQAQQPNQVQQIATTLGTAAAAAGQIFNAGRDLWNGLSSLWN